MLNQNGHSEIIEFLFAKGANIDQANDDNLTPLLIAVSVRIWWVLLCEFCFVGQLNFDSRFAGICLFQFDDIYSNWFVIVVFCCCFFFFQKGWQLGNLQFSFAKRSKHSWFKKAFSCCLSSMYLCIFCLFLVFCLNVKYDSVMVLIFC